MIMLDIPGFADDTITQDGTDNGKRFVNKKDKNTWMTIDVQNSRVEVVAYVERVVLLFLS